MAALWRIIKWHSSLVEKSTHKALIFLTTNFKRTNRDLPVFIAASLSSFTLLSPSSPTVTWGTVIFQSLCKLDLFTDNVSVYRPISENKQGKRDFLGSEMGCFFFLGKQEWVRVGRKGKQKRNPVIVLIPLPSILNIHTCMVPRHLKWNRCLNASLPKLHENVQQLSE